MSLSAPYDRFTNDVADHAMEVLRDDGLYRHLRFARPGTYCMSFDLVTWPGYLAYTGDMGAFVFSRLPDMFEFFRGRVDGQVDFQYWAEKCVASDKSDGLRCYSEERFQQAVKADYDTFTEAHELTPEEAAQLWQDVQDAVLSCGDSHHDAMTAAMNYRWASNGETRGREVFPDFWEHRLEEYTARFVWCCYALPWAIAKYDAAKVAEPA